jgi:hypothetical protein
MRPEISALHGKVEEESALHAGCAILNTKFAGPLGNQQCCMLCCFWQLMKSRALSHKSEKRNQTEYVGSIFTRVDFPFQQDLAAGRGL